ncbi:MAG: putative bifunctional diguanylate cyclase/phosphodiesterase [Anaerovoracaceae bacterium]|jgi:PAS domain S-box-containing protein
MFTSKERNQGQNKAESKHNFKSIRKTRFIIFTLIVLLLSGLYLNFAWNRYKENASDEAIQLGQSLESVFHPEHIAEMSGTADDMRNSDYILVKDSLIRLVKTIKPIYYSYLYIQSEDNLVFLFDSEPYYLDHVMPGEIFEVSEDVYWEPLRTGEAVLTNPIMNSKGSWKSVLVPVKDSYSGNVIAVFAIDFSASEWMSQLRKDMIPDVIIIACIIILCFAFVLSRATAAALSESERSKSVFLSHLPGLAYRCDNDWEWTMQYVSAGCLELTGYPPESLLHNRDKSFFSIIAPEYHEKLRREWKRILEKRIPFKYEYEIITANNKRKWVLEMGQGVYDHEGRVEALEGIILDISERKKVEDDLRYITEHDWLTGLHNRLVFAETLINDAKETRVGKRAAININLNTTQALTKIYGFNYTQELLKSVAKELNQFSSNQCLLFKIYQAQFLFYIREYENKEELLEFCTRVSNVLKSLLSADRISGGIGIVEIDSTDSPNIDQILKKLLIASEKSLNDQDADFYPCFYGAEIELAILREENIKKELAHIIDDENDGGLYLQYQPILDLRTNQISGFEALARIKSDKLGLISPMEFIPLAEETKLIIPISEKITRQALIFLKGLGNLGYEDLYVYINVSVIQLLKEDFVENLFEMIHEIGIDPKRLGIELTESIFSEDYEIVNSVINKLRQAGIYVAIDDFGTGYSTLSREQELNVDCLKIDKSFIDKLLEVSPNKVLVSDIISIAHKLGHYTVAEGVEDKEQFEYLKKWKCDKIQGYFISKPLDKEEAFEFLEKK